MDRGTDAADILRNKVVPLKLGYIGALLPLALGSGLGDISHVKRHHPFFG
jgi:hypothetical protein